MRTFDVHIQVQAATLAQAYGAAFSELYSNSENVTVTERAMADDPQVIASSLMSVSDEYTRNQNGGNPANEL